MAERWLTDWTEKKIAIAEKLNNGECGGSYAESIIILCSVLSAIAADIWPGKHKDKKRFVELLVRYSDENLGAKKVSVPLLIGELRELNHKDESELLFNEIMPSCRSLVVTGSDVDKDEDDIISLCPSVGIKLIRDNSYSHILYKEVRSAYVHQYASGDRSDSWAMASKVKRGGISYVNRVDRPDRLIHYSIDWLIEVVRSVVAAVEKNMPQLVDPKFNGWWLPNK